MRKWPDTERCIVDDCSARGDGWCGNCDEPVCLRHRHLLHNKEGAFAWRCSERCCGACEKCDAAHDAREYAKETARRFFVAFGWSECMRCGGLVDGPNGCAECAPIERRALL
jgi:hypothetical protein